jgi:RimJ/RimL family protein N-acetyltransferase
VRDGDLAVFFEQQGDRVSHQMAAFTAPRGPAEFSAHWAKIRADKTVVLRTVLRDADVAGYVGSFLRGAQREVCYWLGRPHWGRGCASRALELFLGELLERPLHARVAKDNAASARVLEKCRFERAGEERAFAEARGREIDELLFVLR